MKLHATHPFLIKRLVEERNIDLLPEEELSAVLEKIDTHYKIIFVTLAYTGARPNELQALRFRDVD